MAQDWQNLAETCKIKGINVNIDSIDRQHNLKLIKKQGIYAYPTIRLYQKDGEHIDYPIEKNGSNLRENDFLNFLSKNGVNTQPVAASKE